MLDEFIRDARQDNLFRWTKRDLLDGITGLLKRTTAGGAVVEIGGMADLENAPSDFVDTLVGSELGSTAAGWLRAYDEVRNMGRQLRIRDILEVSKRNPTVAREMWIDWQMAQGNVPDVPPTRGGVEGAFGEVESPEDWWKRQRR